MDEIVRKVFFKFFVRYAMNRPGAFRRPLPSRRLSRWLPPIHGDPGCNRTW